LLIGNMQNEEFYRLLKNPGLLNRESIVKLKDIISGFPSFQAARILYLKNLKLLGNPDYENVLRDTAIRIPDRKRLYNYLNAGIPKMESLLSDFYFEQAEVTSVQQDNYDRHRPVHSLIDKFLQKDKVPLKIENSDKPATNEDNEENEVIARSVTETDELITETLAMLYFEQKKYDKATDAFKKLSLKYPEKSSYFATRIEEIEKLKRI